MELAVQSCMYVRAIRPFCFSCPRPGSQPQFLSPSAPLQSTRKLNCSWIRWLCLRNVFWIHPLVSTLIPATLSPSKGYPPNLEEKAKLPTWPRRPCPLLRPPLQTLSPSITPLLQPPASRKPPTAFPPQGLCTAFILLGMTQHRLVSAVQVVAQTSLLQGSGL